MTEVPEGIVIGACNLLDTIKSEWGDQWSEWDQSIRDELSKALAASPAPSDEGVVERMAEALKRLNYVVDNFWNDDKRTENFEAHAYAITRAQGMARAALAAIKGVE